ncbi:MAG: hypothetical protein KJS92_07935 [Bacteroidetes bacterium]|nr:hypothetical protein [Bacteroidota bacterium]
MKRLLFLIVLGFTGICFPNALKAQDDEAQVKSCFSQYQEAIGSKNAAAALKLFSRNSFNYYDSVLRLARFADSQQLSAKGLMCQLLVLTLRVRVPHSEIRVMSGTTLLQYAINSGMIGNVGQTGTNLGEVRVNHDTAWAPLLVEGVETELQLRFIREHQWTLDLVHLVAAGERGMEQMLREADVEPAAFIQMMLARISEGKANAEVWRPVG